MSGLIQKAKEAVDKVVHPEHHKAAPGAGSTNAGPHDSNLANKADPRVDSDRDGSKNAGAKEERYDAMAFPSAATGLTALGASSHTTTHHPENFHQTHGHGHTTGTSTNAGPHDSNLANKADPRVDSDRDGSNTVGTGTTGLTSGPGPAANTAGPHSSDLLNKADPRVDSDLNGSKTVGADKTYQQSGDASTAQVPDYSYAGFRDWYPNDTRRPDAATMSPTEFHSRLSRLVPDTPPMRRNTLQEVRKALEKYGSGRE